MNFFAIYKRALLISRERSNYREAVGKKYRGSGAFESRRPIIAPLLGRRQISKRAAAAARNVWHMSCLLKPSLTIHSDQLQRAINFLPLKLVRGSTRSSSDSTDSRLFFYSFFSPLRRAHTRAGDSMIIGVAAKNPREVFR